MFATSADILNMSLAIGFAVLVAFMSMLIFYCILILRDISKVVDKVETLVNKVSTTILEPLRALDYVFEKSKPFIEAIIERRSAMMAKKPSKGSSKKR